jgi:hypothetical protein
MASEAEEEEEFGEPTAANQLWEIIDILKSHNAFQDFYAYRICLYDKLLYLVADKEQQVNQLSDLVTIPTNRREFVAAKEKHLLITINTTPPPNGVTVTSTIPIFKGKSVLTFNFLEEKARQGKVLQPATFFFTIRSNIKDFEILTSMIQFDIVNEDTKKAAAEIRRFVGDFNTDVLQVRRATARAHTVLP